MDRSRQSNLVTVTNVPILMVGGGATGSNATITLAQMGFSVHVLDPDVVSPENLAAGLFSSRKNGAPKWQGIAALFEMLGGERGLITGERREAVAADIASWEGVAVVGVDSIDVRRELWSGAATLPQLYIDTRIGGHNVVTYSVCDEAQHESYGRSLESEPVDLPCGSKATAYITRMAAAQIANAIVRFTQQQHVPFCQLWEAEGGLIANMG